MKRLAFALVLAGCAPGMQEEPLSGAQPAPQPEAGQFLSGTAGGRAYKLYVPSGYAGSAVPLVMLLHGCAQDPDDFATATQMNVIAETSTFFALYPQESTSDNAEACWNWFQASDQMRGSGEPASLVGVLDHVASAYAVDAARTYALGMSSGGAMATILGATYPDRFSAIASGSGLEYAAATTVLASSSAASQGGPDPVKQGQAAYSAMGTAHRPVRAFVVQGSADSTVAPVNGTQVVAQWAATNTLAGSAVGDTPTTTAQGQVAGGHAYTVTTYADATGRTMIEEIVVDGMSHAWSGGASSGSYTDPKGPSASQLAWDFFSTGIATADAGTTVDLASPGSTDAAATPDASVHTVGPTSPNYGSGCSLGGRSESAPLGLWVLLVGCLVSLRRRRNDLAQ